MVLGKLINKLQKKISLVLSRTGVNRLGGVCRKSPLRLIEYFRNKAIQKKLKLLIINKKSVVPFEYYRYQKIYIPELNRWINRPVEMRRIRLPEDSHYHYVLPFRNPNNFCVRCDGENIIYFGNTLEIQRFIATVYYPFYSNWCDTTYLRGSYLEEFFKFDHNLKDINYFTPLMTLLQKMFYVIAVNEEIIWEGSNIFDISRYKKRIFELEIKDMEELDRLIVYLDFLKWQLKIDSIFSNPNQMYKYFIPNLFYSNYKIPFISIETHPFLFNGRRNGIPLESPGQGLNGPLISQLQALIIFLKNKKINMKAKMERHGVRKPSIKWVNNVCSRVKLQICLAKLHFETFRKTIKANFPSAVKFIGKRALLIFLLANCNKLIIYPLYVLVAFFKKGPVNWYVKYGSLKIRLFNIKLWANTFNLYDYEDKLKVIAFNILISLPLRLIFNILGINNCTSFKEWTDESTEPMVLYMRRVAQKCLPKPPSSFVLGSRMFTYTLNKVLSLHSATRNLVPRVNGRICSIQNTLEVSNANFLLREHWQDPATAVRAYALLDETQVMVKNENVREDRLITFRGEHSILGLPPFGMIPLAKNALTNSFESSTVSEFLAGAFILGESLYIKHKGNLFKFVGFSPHQPGRLFSVLTDEEKLLAKFKNEPKNDITAHFQNCQDPGEEILVSVEVKFPKAPRDCVRHISNCTVVGDRGRIIVFSELSNIPPYPQQRWNSEIMLEKVQMSRMEFDRELLDSDDIFFVNRSGQLIYGFSNEHFDPIMSNMDWVKDQEYQSAVHEFYNKNLKELKDLSVAIKDSSFDPLTNKPLLYTNEPLIHNLRKAVEDFVEKAE